MDSPTRDTTIDGLKAVAAGSIVMHHVSAVATGSGGGSLAAFLWQGSYWALFFFFAVSGYFHGAVGGRGTRWLARRLTRLGVPYAVWSLVYLGWGALSSYLDGARWTAPPAWRVILFAGAHEVLWSLPMLLACAVLADTLVRTPRHRRILIVVFGIATVATYFLVPTELMTTSPLRQFILGARWLFVYLLGMEARAVESANWDGVLPQVIAYAAIIAAGAIGIRGVGGIRSALALTAIDSVIAIALLLGVRAGASWAGVARIGLGGRLLLGVYVSHYLWLEVLMRLLPPAAINPTVWILVSWTLVFSAACATALALGSSRWTRLAVT